MIRPSARSPLLPLAACALAFAAAPTPAAAAPADPAPLLLRLPDLGSGYVVGVNELSSGNEPCLALQPSTRVMSRLRKLAPFRGCWLSFARAWTFPSTAPRPESVDSLAFTFDDPARARSMLANAPSLAADLFGLRADIWQRTPPAPPVGDETALWRAYTDLYGPGLRRYRVELALVVWRFGSTLGLLLVDGDPRSDAVVQAALRLAAIQQARIAMPTPLSARINDDRLVLLDDPGLGVPVMWLGERLPARGRFPALRLGYTSDWSSVDERPKPRVRLTYGTSRLGAATTIELWRKGDLRRHLVHLLSRHQCNRRFAVTLPRLPRARAWVRATYSRAHTRCRRGGTSYIAIAFFGGVGVTVDATSCCNFNRSPYDSRSGLRRLLRALRPRRPGAVTTP